MYPDISLRTQAPTIPPRKITITVIYHAHGYGSSLALGSLYSVTVSVRR